MGITGLLPFVKKSSRVASLQEFRGQTAAVDAYCWLHKGAFSCADKLVRGEQTDGYIIYMMKQINMLLSYNIKPILVFDGCNLPSKAVTETKRRENRERNRQKAKQLLREGKVREARECFQRCVDVTSEMAFHVISACRARNIDIIVAPYEADAQLAYLNQCGLAQVIITEDSDLILFGCSTILFKMDSNGGCILVEKEKLHLSMNVPRDKFCFEKFCNMCILSGCDYLPSLPGIGLAKACKFFNATMNPDTHNVLRKLPTYLKMPHLEVTEEYRNSFLQARNTFLYQLVFDPRSRRLRPLQDYPEGLGPDDFPYAGKFVGHERALQLALGNINVQSGKTIHDFCPDTHKPVAPKSSAWHKHGDLVCSHPSIWSSQEDPLAPTTTTQPCPDITAPTRRVTVKTPTFKRKLEAQAAEQNVTEEELCDLYNAPHKHPRVEELPDLTNDSGVDTTQTEAKDQALDRQESEEGSTENSQVTESNNTVSPADNPPEGQQQSSQDNKSRNPFAKSNSNHSTNRYSHFSALKKFNKIKKTVIDENTIVFSRYFSPMKTEHSESPESKPKLEYESQTGPGDHKEPVGSFMHTTPKDDELPGAHSPLSPVHLDSKLSGSKDSFSWGKLTDKFKYSNNNYNSKASMNSFKSVTPAKDEMEPQTETSSKQEIIEEDMSQVSKTSDYGSLEGDSSTLVSNSSPPPLPSPTAKMSPSFRDMPKDSAPCLSTPTPRRPLHNKCKAPGLIRPKNKQEKKEPGIKQLSLHDMFGYKKDGHKLQSVRP